MLAGMGASRERIKRAQRRVLDVMNSVGMGDSMLRLIERRQRSDVYLAIGGMVRGWVGVCVCEREREGGWAEACLCASNTCLSPTPPFSFQNPTPKGLHALLHRRAAVVGVGMMMMTTIVVVKNAAAGHLLLSA